MVNLKDSARIQILHIGEDQRTCGLLYSLFFEEAVRIHEVRSLGQAFRVLKRRDFFLIACDGQVGEMPGGEFLAAIRHLQPGTKRVLVSLNANDWPETEAGVFAISENPGINRGDIPAAALGIAG